MDKHNSIKIVKQGKYECAVAALAQLLEKPLSEVKRAMSKTGWRNDDQGASDAQLAEAARAFGKDLVFIGRKTTNLMVSKGILPKSVLTIDSLNYEGKYHGVSYLPERDIVIDPNYEYPDRKYLPLNTKIIELELYAASVLVDRVLTDAERWELKFIRGSTIHDIVEYLGLLGICKGEKNEVA